VVGLAAQADLKPGFLGVFRARKGQLFERSVSGYPSRMQRRARGSRSRGLNAAGPLVVERLGLLGYGLTEVRWTRLGSGQDGPGVWLCTSTDSERDRLSLETDLDSIVGETLWRSGAVRRDIENFVVRVQSQETVDRDYGSSWFYATSPFALGDEDD